jgi:hypothetical protein
MAKRSIAAFLWLLAVWTVGGALNVFAGSPDLLGPAAGLLVAWLVWQDPGGRIWGARVDRARVRRRLADLPRVTESASDVELRPEVDPAKG